MRYSKKIVKQITEELQKIPNIRHVCQKVGIDHSTFYRWMTKHFEFHKAVEDAIYFGRKNINDAAESVIVSGIQRGDLKSAQYWLSHNNERYVPERRVKYFQYLEHFDLEFLKKEVPDDSEFERLFRHYFIEEETYGKEEAKKRIEIILEVVCQNDPQLKDVFYAAYTEWKDRKKDYLHKMSKFDGMFPDMPLNLP